MYNNCNDYERIKRKIDEEQKKYKFCYIQGPTGPKGNKGDKGDVGPATINIGSTQTIDEGLAAKVSNVGTKDDVILNFEIPRGMKGDKGEQGIPGIQGIKGDKGDIGLQGIKGERGEQGPSTIKIGKAETLEPDIEAQVTNVGTPTDVILDFKIPKGEKGDAGAKGDQGSPGTPFVSSYGLRYAMTDTQLALNQATDTIIPLPEKGVSFFTEYPDDNSIKIKETGTYLVSYLLCGATSEECALTMSVRANNLLQPATSVTKEFQAQIIGCISGSTIVSLQENDLVTLNVKASMTINIRFNGSTNAMLSVIKIH